MLLRPTAEAREAFGVNRISIKGIAARARDPRDYCRWVRSRRNVPGANLGQCANSGSSALVSMMETAYFGEHNDSPHLRRLHGPAIGRILPKRKLAAGSKIIIDVGSLKRPVTLYPPPEPLKRKESRKSSPRTRARQNLPWMPDLTV